MNLNELATAVRYNIPIVVLIMNNGVLGMVRQWQTLFYNKHYSNTVLNRKTDFVAFAKAFGADGEAVDVTVADFRDGFRLISYPVDCRKAEAETPHLPVTKQLWTPKCGLKKGSTEWIKAGGGHHTVLSFRLTEEQIHDLGVMLGMNLVEIC